MFIILVHCCCSTVPMSDDTSKAWKKTEDIPRRFDELPPEPEWVPVADVIRTHREEEARQEAQKIKIKPPMDSDSDSESVTQRERAVKKEKPPVYKKNEIVRKHEMPMKFSGMSTTPTVDDVTQSMLDWALSTDHYRKTAPKHPSHHKEYSKSLVDQQRPPHLVLHKDHNERDRQVNKQPSRLLLGDNKKHTTPHKRHHSQPDELSPQRMQGYPPGAARTRAQQSASSHKEGHPLYEEPSPDYDDEDYDAYFSRFQEQYYYDHDLKKDEQYYQEQSYEDEVVVDPYHYKASPYHDKYSSYNPQHVYNDPPEDFGHEFGMPQYPYEDQRGYPEAFPHYSQMPHEIQRDKPRSKYDVLY